MKLPEPAGADWTLGELQSLSFTQLEALWANPIDVTTPSGLYRGHVLGRIDHPTSRRRFWRWSEGFGFECLPFGIDFDRSLWFFVGPVLALGRFEARVGPSRWRATEAISLNYECSKLPRLVRDVLYDEVKPLSKGWMLGIGGINAGPGVGDHFYFVLERAHRG